MGGGAQAGGRRRDAMLGSPIPALLPSHPRVLKLPVAQSGHPPPFTPDGFSLQIKAGNKQDNET